LKKILLVSHSQKTGGAERCLLEAAVGLRKRGFDVTIFLPSRGELTELLEDNSISYQITPYPWWVHKMHPGFGLMRRIRSFFSILKYSVKLAPRIKALRPDIVLSNTICNPCAALVSKLAGIKHIWFIHEFGKEDHKLIFDFGFFLSSSFISFTSRQVLVNSPLICEKYSRFIGKEKMRVVEIDIPAPVVSDEARRFNPSSFDLLVVGQITETKGQLDAVRALHQVRKEGYDARLIIIGLVNDESYFNIIRDFIRVESLEDYVSIQSHANYPFRDLRRFTIALMCSAFEALGRVTVEYMKAGLPVIGANAGSTARLIHDGKTGLLYELRNPADLANKIKQILSDKTLVQQLTKTAESFADANFNEENYINGIIKSFESV
jgi:glycosyltransferase involved in cell wall biosynthesis